jgi:hypothetical protein
VEVCVFVVEWRHVDFAVSDVSPLRAAPQEQESTGAAGSLASAAGLFSAIQQA